MTTNREQGEKLLKEAEWIFEKDLKNAMKEGNYNIAVRRAQEVVFKKDSLKEIERISRWLSEARAPSFYGERDFTSEDAKKAFEDATFVLKEIKATIMQIYK